MKDNVAFKFTCSSCGGHTLTLTHVWSILAGENSERWREWGPLKDSHHWQYEFKEKVEKNADREVQTGDFGEYEEDDSAKVEKNADREVQRGDFGEYEEDDSASEPEEYEIFESETNRESDEFFVNCENCDREIEFGWSQPDRRGLILPVEFSDFNPSKSWPDPKYLDIWQQRGWVRK